MAPAPSPGQLQPASPSGAPVLGSGGPVSPSGAGPRAGWEAVLEPAPSHISLSAESPTAAALARQLVDHLAAMVEPWAQLLEAARAMNRALVAGDAAAIEAALAGEQRQLQRIDDLERRRFDLQRRLAATWGLDAAALSWEELARRCPELAPSLARCRAALQALAEGVEVLNRQNRGLARQGLAWARFGLQTLAAARGAAAPGYGPDGRIQWRPSALAVDRAY